MRKKSTFLDDKMNLILVGESNVGKTSLLNQYSKGHFSTQVIATVGKTEYYIILGLEYFTKEEVINDKKVKIKLWDTAGQEQYKSLTKNFYRNASGVIVVFDVANRKSFECVEEWTQNIKDYGPKEIIIALVGNKIDLDRDVSIEEATKLSKTLKIKYFECSAKENIGFQSCVVYVSSEICKSKIKTEVTSSFLENAKKEKEKNDCNC